MAYPDSPHNHNHGKTCSTLLARLGIQTIETYCRTTTTSMTRARVADARDTAAKETKKLLTAWLPQKRPVGRPKLSYVRTVVRQLRQQPQHSSSSSTTSSGGKTSTTLPTQEPPASSTRQRAVQLQESAWRRLARGAGRKAEQEVIPGRQERPQSGHQQATGHGPRAKGPRRGGGDGPKGRAQEACLAGQGWGLTAFAENC
jgi:hypothetical protein